MTSPVVLATVASGCWARFIQKDMAKVASSGAMIFLSTEAAPMAPQPCNRRGSCTKIAIDHERLTQGLKYFRLHVPDVHQLAPASSSNARLKQH